MSFEFSVPGKIVFGNGKLNELSSQKLPGKSAIVVISNGKSAKTNGSLDRLMRQLDNAGVSAVIYDRIEANPVLETIDAGGDLCRKYKCDFVVAMGGGSVIDSGKMITILASNPGSIWDYVQTGTGGKKQIENDPIPLVAIPTTAGTGSEADFGASFTKEQTNEKISVIDKRLFPALTIVDPELTYSLAAKFTAYQGWDALTHSMEYLLNKNQNLICDSLAKEAVKLCGEALAEAVVSGTPESREKMALASCLSGIVIGHGGVTSQHALECAVSAVYPKLAHGAGLIMLSKAYFKFFIDKHVCDEIFIEIASLLGMKDASSPYDFITAIEQLQHACGVDNLKMSDYGIKRSDFGGMIAASRVAMGCDFEVDRYTLTDEDCMEIMQNSYS